MAVERAGPGLPEWAELSGPHLARYLFAMDFAREKTVLDAGCGSGYGCALLRHGGAARVVGVDRDARIIEQAIRQYGRDGVEFVEDDCQALTKVSAPIDLICNFENIEHLDDPRRFLARAAELLTAGGVLLVSTPDRSGTPPYRDGKPRNPFHVREWLREEFAALLGEFFPRVEMRVQVRSAALEARLDAVEALKDRLTLGNPLATLLWRKLPIFSRDGRHAWNRLSGLAAPSVGDFPIVDAAIAPILGRPFFHVGICRK